MISSSTPFYIQDNIRNVHKHTIPTFTPVTSSMTQTVETVQFIRSLEIKVNMIEIHLCIKNNYNHDCCYCYINLIPCHTWCSRHDTFMHIANTLLSGYIIFNAISFYRIEVNVDYYCTYIVCSSQILHCMVHLFLLQMFCYIIMPNL